jgi:signal peptidase I
MIESMSKKDVSPKAEADGEKPRNTVAEWAVTILLLVFGTSSLAQPFVIPTSSMEDSLLVGDHLIVDKLAFAPAGSISKYLLPYEEPKHGDVIVFRYPGDVTQTYVKRLIGVPGDRIKLVNGVVFRNGVRLNEPYAFQKFTYDAGRDNFPGSLRTNVRQELALQLQREMLERNVVDGEVVVPPGNYFAMGDNRDNSEDSRYWGFVPRQNIIGKPVLVYWSYKAPTEDLLSDSANSMLKHFVDVGEHFFTHTRWSRTFMLVRGFPDASLPDHEIPVNHGNPDP